MKKEYTDIIKGIMVVIGLLSVTIFICLRIMDRNFVYFINYFQGENKYEIKISDDYRIKIDISIICNEEKCHGDYTNKISSNANISKEKVKALIKEFNLKKNVLTETNESRVNLRQKELITEVIR